MTPRSVLSARLLEAAEDHVRVQVEGPGGGVLEYRSPDPVWAAPPPNLDFAAVALAQHAATEGCDLVLEGQVSREQLDRLDEYLAIWASWRPDKFHKVSVSAEEEIELAPPPGRGGAVMGFSGGVDASFALAAHNTRALGRFSRPVETGVLVVGWDLKHGDDLALERARTSARRSLDEYGVRLAVVGTNWQQDFCNAWFMTFNAAVVGLLHTFSATHSAAVFGTDRSYREELKIPPYGSHLMINHLLGNPLFPVVSTGGTHTRAERIAFLKDHPVLVEELRVCWQLGSRGGNCGHCEKCVRTQLEMRAAGVPTEAAFPEPFTAHDVRSIELHHRHVVMHFQNVLERLDPSDEAHTLLKEWLQSHRRAATPPRVERLTQRVADLERELALARKEMNALRASTSWRVTGPLRAVSGRARRLRT